MLSTLNLDYNRKDPRTYVKASFHEKEFTPSELSALLKSVFPCVDVYGLYPRWRYRLYKRCKKLGLDRWGASAHNLVRRFFAEQLDTNDHALCARADRGAIDLIAICHKSNS